MFNRQTCSALVFFVIFFGYAFSNEPYDIEQDRKYELSICAIFKNDDRFLHEWIQYHKLMGAEHFWLYNNDSTDQYLSVLQPYINSGEVELIDWAKLPGEAFDYGCQTRAYTDVIARAQGKTKWLAIIDTDEFLLPLYKNNLIEVLNETTNVAIYCLWRCFGDSGVYKIKGLMINELTSCSYEDNFWNIYSKTIFRPEFASYYFNPHWPVLPEHAFYYINSINGHWPKDVSKEIRINHYWSRDRLFFNQTKIAREEQFGYNDWSCLQRLSEYNTEKNTEILRFVPLLKKQMREFKAKLNHRKK